jgi:peptide/nickel transport system permease protein
MTAGSSPLDAGGPSSAPGFLARLRRKPVGVAAFGVVLAIVLAAIAAPLIAPYAPNAADLLHPLANPSWHHLLGTDELGRDIFSRLLYGARPTLLYGLEAVAVTFGIALPIGLVAGFFGGGVDRALMQINDVGLSVPVMVVVLLVLSVFQNHFWIAMVALGVLLVPPLVRNIRGAVIAVRNELFVDAAQIAGLSRPQIVRRHILPRVRGPVLVQLTLVSGLSVLFTVGLGFLGFGIQPPNPSWGTMTSEASQELVQSPWLLIASGGITGIFVLCLGLVGDAVRDASVEAWAGEPTTARKPRAPAIAPAGDHHDAPDPAALLSVRGLSIAFQRRGREVLVASDVSFDIGPGETVGLVGESGCGKTSVARAIIRLHRGEGRIVSGQVQFDGRDVLALDPGQLTQFRGSSVGYISQEPMVALDPSFRVGSLLREAVRSHTAISRSQASRRVLELLELVRLPDPEHVAKLYPFELSGGMAQRVSIARALARGPRLLIADEPTTALDVTVQSEILELLRSVQAETGMAILLVSHDWGVVAQLCRRAIVMYAGEIVEAPTIAGTVPDPESWPAACRFNPRCPYRIEGCTAGPIGLESVASDRMSRCIRSQELIAREVAGVAG